MAATPQRVEKALKVKSLLAAYYSEGDQAPEQDVGSQSTPSRPPSTPMAPSPARSVADSDVSRSGAALDAPQFDADAHLRRLIREARLGALVDQHRALAAEVGALDSDMQTLVYENYSKFIAATDIIRALDGAVGGLDGQLRRLGDLIGGAEGRSEGINATLEQRQAAIMELKRTRELLRQVAGALEVPRRLRAALAAGALDIAADVYADVAPVLRRHGHRKALRKVAAEAEACRAEAAAALRRRLLDAPESAAATIQLISRLGEPTASLLDDFLGSQRRRLGAALEGAAGGVAALPALNAAFLPELARTAQLFEELFEAEARPQMVAEAREWLLRYCAAVRAALETAAGAAVAAAAGLDPSGARIVERDGFGEDWGVEALAAALDGVRAALLTLEGPLPELGARDKASELVGNAVRQHVGLAFSAIEARVAVQLRDASAGGGGAVELSLTALRGLEHAVRGVAQWMAQPWTLEGWREVFLTLVQAQTAEWLAALPARCLAAAGLVQTPAPAAFPAAWALPPASDVSPAFLASLAVFCAGGQLRVADRAEELLSREAGVGPGWVGGSISVGSSAASKLAETYRAAVATALGDLMAAAVEDTPWGAHPEPRAPRPVCAKLLEALAAADGELQAAEQEAGAVGAALAGRGHHRRQSTGNASVESLAAGVAAGGNANVPWASRSEVLGAAATAALHAEAAALRRHTLTRAAFQQVQLDCHFLAPALQRAVGGAATAALDEVLVVAAERCGEPVMLEPAALDRMVAAYQQQQAGGAAAAAQRRS